MSWSGPLLELKDWRVRRGRQVALELPSLAVDVGQTLAVIGPNGSGKSTLLLSMARLLLPESGQLLYRGSLVPKGHELEYRRRLGLVLQDPLLLDASVFDNVAVGLRFRNLKRLEVRQRVDEWLQRLGISHLRARHGRQLSGGEAQRVSLARAFALQPELLLLDEPFSALDAPTRTRLLADFKTLLAETGLTTVMVTHDLDEALFLGERVAVLQGGRLRQVGSPQNVFNSPADPEVAAFVGVETVIPGRVITVQDGEMLVEAAGPHLHAVGNFPVGREVLLFLRPEDVTLWPAGAAVLSSARNRLSSIVMQLIPQGPLVRVHLDCGFPLVALVTRTSVQELSFEVGQTVQATFKASAVHVIDRG